MAKSTNIEKHHKQYAAAVEVHVESLVNVGRYLIRYHFRDWQTHAEQNQKFAIGGR